MTSLRSKKKPASTGSNIAPILIFPFFPLLNSKTVNGNFVSRARSLEDTCPCVPRTECPWSVELLKNRMKLSKYHPSKKIITKYINAKVCDASTQNVECCGFKLDLPANPFYKADVNTQNPEKVHANLKYCMFLFNMVCKYVYIFLEKNVSL